MNWWMVAVAAAVVIGVAWGATAWLLREADRAQDPAAARVEAIKTGLGVGAGTGGVFALLLAVRRQWHQEISSAANELDAVEKRVTELYTKAVEQLGSDKAPVRLGGLYALERLAQDNPRQRQTIVNVMCAYLRMRYLLPDEPPAVAADTQTQTEYWERVQEREVRLGTQRILADHLRAGDDLKHPVSTFWPAIDLDLANATLIDFDLAHCRVDDVKFGGARFSGDAGFGGARFYGDAAFDQAQFGGTAGFSGARFSGDAGFDGAQFDGTAEFSRTQFDGTARFGRAQFNASAEYSETEFNEDAVFDKARFGSTAIFGGARFSGHYAGFNGARFSAYAGFGDTRFIGGVVFDKAQFNADAKFDQARFGGAQFYDTATFSEARFNGHAGFDKARFSGDATFNIAQFSSDADFDNAQFSRYAQFDGAQFNGIARFGEARFSGTARRRPSEPD